MLDSYSVAYTYGMGAAFAILAVIYLFLIAFMIVVYVFGAVGLYRMAKNRGFENSWMAWVPICSTYLTLKLVEPFHIGRRRIDRFASIYLLVYILCVVAAVFSVLLMFISLFFVLFVVLTWIALIALSVLFYVVYYRIFKQYSPDNAVLFLVLTIVVGASPFILFALRNKTPVLPSEDVSPLERLQ